MKQLAQGLLHYGVLIAVTVVAVMVMYWASGRAHTNGNTSNGHADGQAIVAAVSTAARPKPLVDTQHLAVESCEIASKFTGKLRPWETFSLAFEVPGRVVKLGTSDQNKSLDDGDMVEPGQLLAKMDDRTYRARKSEAVAQLEQAETDMNRIRALRERNIGAVTETDYQAQLTEVALARAQHEVALKNLEDTQLVSPVVATISRRMVNAGESVQANQMAFELVQVDDLLLVVDVPESQIYELQARQQEVRKAQGNKSQENGRNKSSDAKDQIFRAHVTLEGRDRFGKRLPTIDAEVYQIAQVADALTGLFEVEIRVPNPDHSLRAGMVATARIVSARIDAYRIPETAVIFRNREAYLFAIDTESQPQSVMFWDIGSVLLRKSRRVSLTRWLDQGSWIIVPADAHEFDEIVIRGQQRLADGQFVRVLTEEASTTKETRVTTDEHG